LRNVPMLLKASKTVEHDRDKKRSGHIGKTRGQPQNQCIIAGQEKKTCKKSRIGSRLGHTKRKAENTTKNTGSGGSKR